MCSLRFYKCTTHFYADEAEGKFEKKHIDILIEESLLGCINEV